MREGSFEGQAEDERPIYVASVRRDGRLRGDWQAAAETIAHVEGGIALLRREQLSEAPAATEDAIEPGFIMVGRRQGLAAIAETATGIIEHGQAFRAWADLVGDDPAALQQFDEAYLGDWESPAEFAARLIEQDLLSPNASEDERRAQSERLAGELADELERRGDLRAISRPQGGVWLFRAHDRDAASRADAEGEEDERD